MATYRLRDTTGDDLSVIEHLAPNFEVGDVVRLPDGREVAVHQRPPALPDDRGVHRRGQAVGRVRAERRAAPVRVRQPVTRFLFIRWSQHW